MGHHKCPEGRVRLPTWRNRSVTRIARTQVPGDSSILPLWPGALHKGRHEVLRVGECKELVQVRENDISGGLGRAEKQQLLDEVGRLIVPEYSRLPFASIIVQHFEG